MTNLLNPKTGAILGELPDTITTIVEVHDEASGVLVSRKLMAGEEIVEEWNSKTKDEESTNEN